ncbi:MAG TPA: FAD-dependent oxidoreductase [Verrucomicrobiales bacterium]|nr:FAD-dependent oxidoreductase [Verrucomicrobiales bacterium]
MSESKHVLIVGGGVIGLCTAHYALERGHRVTLLERGPATHDSCSLGNAGMVVPSHFVPLAAPGAVALGLKWMWNPASPFYIKPRLDWDLLAWGWKFFRSANAAHVARSAPLIRDLSLASRALFADLAARHGDGFGFTPRGLLMFCKTPHALEEEARAAEQARSLGIPAEVLSAEAVAKLDPGVRYDIAGAVYFPKDCHLDPGRFIGAMTRSLVERGADLRFDSEVTDWSTSGDRVTGVETASGRVTADEYVVAGGSWSPGVARGLAARLPMQAGKGYSLTLKTPRQLPALCSIFTEARVAITPIGGALRFGGTMEIAGMDESINPVRVRGIIQAVPRYFPEFRPEDFEGVPVWRGLRPCSPDGLPYVGRLPRWRNASVATGHAMMGLSLGPITGRLMSEILSGDPPSMDLRLLDPSRFA